MNSGCKDLADTPAVTWLSKTTLSIKIAGEESICFYLVFSPTPSCCKFYEPIIFLCLKTSSFSFTIPGAMSQANSSQPPPLQHRCRFPSQNLCKHHLSNVCKVTTYASRALSSFYRWDFATIFSTARDFQRDFSSPFILQVRRTRNQTG